MFLSRLILDPRSRQVWSELTNPYEMHRTLLQAFGQARCEADMLYRVDTDRRSGVPTVLVQSLAQPDWSFACGLGRYLLDAEPGNPACKPFEPVFAERQLLQFRLLANPTKKLSNRSLGNRNGKRVGLYEEGEQRDWLDRKGRDGGFRILSCHVISEGKTEHTKGSAGAREKMPLLAVRFDGVLQVADPAVFLATIQSGIGSAKAFGFGLLSVARA
jgi:CRISPR system Cascade subunit CasE